MRCAGAYTRKRGLDRETNKALLMQHLTDSATDGNPGTGGLSTHQAQSIVRGLCGTDFVGMDVVEVPPAYDVADNTALAAASIALDYLCVLAQSRPDAT